MQLVNIGYGNLVSANRVIAVVSPDSSPVKRMVQDARKSGVLIDATLGRKTRSVLAMDSGHIILSALQLGALQGRLTGKETDSPEEEEEI